jgi:hypothetical protein
LPIAVNLGKFELQLPGMKKILLFLCVFSSLSVSLCAQKKARVLTENINGKISKAEVEFIDYREDGERSSFFEMKKFYFDDDQNLIKEEQLLDYTRTDYRKKPKPTVTVYLPSGYQDPVTPPRKADTSYTDSEKGKLMTLTYENGAKSVIGKQNSPPYHTIRTYINEKGLITYRAEYRENGSLESEIRFEDNPGSDTSSISMYDEHENRVKYTPYENNRIDLAHCGKNIYYYDSHGNIERWVSFDWDVKGSRWKYESEVLYKYYYIKDSGSKEKTAAQSADSDTASEETSEPKEKKSLKDKLNVFKKKD